MTLFNHESYLSNAASDIIVKSLFIHPLNLVSLSSPGPTDLSVKGTSKPTRPSLNAVEVAAVRQLITGYRESAAFLLRSADELENLLIHQQSP